MPLININGRLTADSEGSIAADNRALRYGYGLFETMLVKDGAIRLGQAHWERLAAGMAALNIPVEKFFLKKTEDALWQTVRKAALEALCRVRLQVYAGNGGLYDGDFKVGFIIEVFPVQKSMLELNQNGLTVGYSDVVKHTGAIAHIKSCAALPYALAARQAKESRWNDALLLNERGRAAESTIANIFWVTKDGIFTPPLSEGCIAGVMRHCLLENSAAFGYITAEQACERADLESAEAVFLTNAIRGIQWVGAIGNRHYSAGICSDLHQRLLRHL